MAYAIFYYDSTGVSAVVGYSCKACANKYAEKYPEAFEQQYVYTKDIPFYEKCTHCGKVIRK